MCESCCGGRPTPGRGGTANGVKGASSDIIQIHKRGFHSAAISWKVGVPF